MKSPKCAWPHTVTLEKKQSTQTDGNGELLSAQHIQRQEADAEQLGNGVNCATVPRTCKRQIE